MNEWTLINARNSSDKDETFMNGLWDIYLNFLKNDPFLTIAVTIAVLIISLISSFAWCYCCWQCFCRIFCSKSKSKTVVKRTNTFRSNYDPYFDQWLTSYNTLLDYDDFDDYDDDFRRRKRKWHRSYSRNRSIRSYDDSRSKRRRSYSLRKDSIFDTPDYSYQYRNPYSNIGTKTRENYEELLFFLKESMKKKKNKKHKQKKIVNNDRTSSSSKRIRRKEIILPEQINLEPTKSIMTRIESLKSAREVIKSDINKKIQLLVNSINREVRFY